MSTLSYPLHVCLGQFPTPIEKLERLSRHLGGPDIYIKRDDQTGLATGGNKTRKLEFVLAEALVKGCDHVVTFGGSQSNHARQTAAAAAKLGLGCSLALRGDTPRHRLGNLLLDDLLGADVQFSGTSTREELAENLMESLRAAGKRPYLIPLGASTGLGAVGYVQAMEETLEQLRSMDSHMDAMIVASSSAGTQAGLALGQALFSYPGQVLGISIDATVLDLTRMVRTLAMEASNVLGVDIPELRIEVNANYLGGGYSIVGDLERDAIRTVARFEGILLDPVYTGRAMGGLMDLIRRGVFTSRQRILFWHTGGPAALSAFADVL